MKVLMAKDIGMQVTQHIQLYEHSPDRIVVSNTPGSVVHNYTCDPPSSIAGTLVGEWRLKTNLNA